MPRDLVDPICSVYSSIFLESNEGQVWIIHIVGPSDCKSNNIRYSQFHGRVCEALQNDHLHFLDRPTALWQIHVLLCITKSLKPNVYFYNKFRKSANSRWRSCIWGFIFFLLKWPWRFYNSTRCFTLEVAQKGLTCDGAAASAVSKLEPHYDWLTGYNSLLSFCVSWHHDCPCDHLEDEGWSKNKISVHFICCLLL